MNEIEDRLNNMRWTTDNLVYPQKRWVTEVEGTLIKDIIKISGAKSYVESGTANGFSAMWASLGLPEDGKVYTFDPINRPKLYEDKNIGCIDFTSKIEFIQEKFEDLEGHLILFKQSSISFIS